MRTRVGLASLIAGGALSLAACGGGDPSADAYCDQVAEAEESGVENALSEVEPDDLEGAREAIGEVRMQVDSLREVAPGEIQADVDAVAEGFRRIETEFSEARSPEELEERFVEVQQELAGIAEPIDQLDQFEDANCDDEDE